MIKYDYQLMIKDNMDKNTSRFKVGGIFDKIGADSILWGNEYIASIYFIKYDEKRSHYSYHILLSQNGVSLEIGQIKPKSKILEFAEKIALEASEKMAELWVEIKKYQFEPYGYELWSDNPNTPFYLKKGERPLCENFVLLDDD